MSAIDPITKHRRDVWLRIVLPVGLAAGLLVLTLVVLFTLAVAGILSQEQISTIASIMLSVCVLLPLTLIMMLLAAIFIGMAWAVAKLPGAVTGPLRQLRFRVTGIAASVPGVSTRLVRPLIALDSRLTRWEYFVRGLVGVQPTSEEQEGLKQDE